MKQPLSVLKSWFTNFRQPTGTNFSDWMDSYFHKDEKIPALSIDGLANAEYKGLALADTDPGEPDHIVKYDATAGVTYANFRDSGGNPITIPTESGGKTVVGARLIGQGAVWQMDLSSMGLDGVTMEVDFQPVKEYVNTLEPVIFTTDIDGYVLAFVDADGRLLGGWQQDGSFIASKYLSESLPGSTLKDGTLTIDKIDGNFANYILKVVDPESGYIGGIFDVDDRILLGIRVDGSVIFKNSDITLLKEQVAQIIAGNTGEKKFVYHGDSLTEGAGGNGVTYPSVIQSLLPSGTATYNRGVGGETVPSIAARQGGVPAVLGIDIVLPALATEKVQIADYTTRLKNGWEGKNVSWLMQSISSKVNPVYVNGIACTITATGTLGSPAADTVWWLNRNVSSDSETFLKAGEPIYTSDSRNHQNPYFHSIFIGQNGGWDTPANLVEYINRMHGFYNPTHWIVIGLHSGTAVSRQELEKACSDAFGLRYINTRAYMSTYGIADAGITPTTADTNAMAVGSCPPSLLSDTVHYNSTGYTLLGKLIYKRMQELGITPLT